MATQDLEGSTDRRIFRNATYPVLGWALVALAAAAWVFWLIYTDGSAPSLACPAAVTPLAAVGWLGYVRPRVVADPDGVTVVNPTRTVRLSWSEISKFKAQERLLIVPKGRDAEPIAAWAVQSANIARMTGKVSHADRVAVDLNKLLARYRGGPVPEVPIGAAVKLAGMQWASIAVGVVLLLSVLARLLVR